MVQPRLGRSNPDIHRVIVRDIGGIGANDDRDHKWETVDRIARNHQDRPAAGLFPAADGIERREVNLAALNHS